MTATWPHQVDRRGAQLSLALVAISLPLARALPAKRHGVARARTALPGSARRAVRVAARHRLRKGERRRPQELTCDQEAYLQRSALHKAYNYMIRPGLEPGISVSAGRRLIH